MEAALVDAGLSAWELDTCDLGVLNVWRGTFMRKQIIWPAEWTEEGVSQHHQVENFVQMFSW